MILRASAVLVLLAGVGLALSAMAAEIDSVTRRDEPLADASRSIERRLNGALRAGVATHLVIDERTARELIADS